ncbi:MAG TPA: alkaline phosphatase family protein [Candidatus Limnocylindria bacterium]|nr:alkaline phosphatase family protein [Candidatus Limnocylindria bacterium]
MPAPLIERLVAHGFRPPDHDGGGLLNVPATVLDVFGAREADDPPPLRGIRPDLLRDVRVVVTVLADGLGLDQLRGLAQRGDTPFLAGILERAARGDAAQLLEATTVFPSTTAAAITTMNTARTPQEHGNIAYFLWLEEFGQVTQMLRWGPAATARGSYFDGGSRDPRAYARARSIHARLRERGVVPYIVEPELFRTGAMIRMHAADAEHCGYLLPSTLGVRLRSLVERRPWGGRPAYLYAYWSGVDTAAHWFGPRSPEHDAEGATLDLALGRALGGREPGDVLVIFLADHGHSQVDPAKLIDIEADAELRLLLRNPPAGEPRCVFFHTDRPQEVRAHLARRYGDAFFTFDRDEAIAAGIFGGRGDGAIARRRVGDVCGLLAGDRGAGIVRVDGQLVLHRGSHGGMTPEEMTIPILCWRA